VCVRECESGKVCVRECERRYVCMGISLVAGCSVNGEGGSQEETEEGSKG